MSNKGAGMPPLNERGRLFCEVFFETGLGYRAALRAGYRKRAVAALNGGPLPQALKDALTREAWRLKQDPRVQTYLAELKERQRARELAEQEQRPRARAQVSQRGRAMMGFGRLEHRFEQAMEDIRRMSRPIEYPGSQVSLKAFGRMTDLREFFR